MKLNNHTLIYKTWKGRFLCFCNHSISYVCFNQCVFNRQLCFGLSKSVWSSPELCITLLKKLVDRKYVKRSHVNSIHVKRSHVNSLHVKRSHVNSIHVKRSHVNSLHVKRSHVNSLHVKRSHVNSLHDHSCSPQSYPKNVKQL